MSDFNEEIAFYAFRYALGRMTYAVGDVSDYLIENWNRISVKTKRLIIKEIKESIDKGKSGMEVDIKCWRRILLMSEAEDKL